MLYDDALLNILTYLLTYLLTYSLGIYVSFFPQDCLYGLDSHRIFSAQRFLFLANVNSRSRSLYAVARPSVCLSSVVCNARAPYSVG